MPEAWEEGLGSCGDDDERGGRGTKAPARTYIYLIYDTII